ncbi:MAG TPA: putative Na+/H+ antiporter [Methylomirabilota bacterium]|nr:putative Na+/H+ antiporter [Methylomirabilota bacterium]
MWLLALLTVFGTGRVSGAAVLTSTNEIFPKPLESYQDASLPLGQQLLARAKAEPLNWVATLLFVCAVLHTFAAPKIMHLAHSWRHEHRKVVTARHELANRKRRVNAEDEVSFKAEVAHFFGEIEAVFGIWVIPLLVVFALMKGWSAAEHYVSHTVKYTEPLFVVVIMTIAASRPVLMFSERIMRGVAGLFGGGVGPMWLSVLTIGPLLGSVITEPAAMTISALLLARGFYEWRPSPAFAYATIGLLFVNVSIGGTLTNFAAPPVLMVAGTWGWSTPFMLQHFGWKSAAAIVVSNAVYWMWFRKEFSRLSATTEDDSAEELWEERKDPVPGWITAIHLLFLGWTVFVAHYPALFIGALLFFLAFVSATAHHQNKVVLRPALLVGFFLAGLVIHGGLQSWWIAPVLTSLSDLPMFFGAVILTAFNDNAAITYLASLVPTLTPEMKYAVVAGAVTGGGLTVIANAPNPAGQAILVKYFPDGLSPLKLLLGALPPTIIATVFFLLFGR